MIVCNSVLLVVPREKIPASLREIQRIAKPVREYSWEKSLSRNSTIRLRTSRLDGKRSVTYTVNMVSRTWFGMLRRMTLVGASWTTGHPTPRHCDLFFCRAIGVHHHGAGCRS